MCSCESVAVRKPSCLNAWPPALLGYGGDWLHRIYQQAANSSLSVGPAATAVPGRRTRWDLTLAMRTFRRHPHETAGRRPFSPAPPPLATARYCATHVTERHDQQAPSHVSSQRHSARTQNKAQCERLDTQSAPLVENGLPGEAAHPLLSAKQHAQSRPDCEQALRLGAPLHSIAHVSNHSSLSALPKMALYTRLPSPLICSSV